MNEVFKDLFCGWLSGIGQVLTMMPFENIKIKLVSKPDQYTGIMQCLRKSLAQEGFISFYKGMLGNLFGVGPQVALQFGAVETMKKYFKRTFEPNAENLSIHYTAISGLAAGIPSALVVTPLDHARFRVALIKQKVQGGSLGVIKRIYAEYGFRKLYLGFSSTLLRESLGLGVYFTVYHYLSLMLNQDTRNPTVSMTLLSGGLSGLLSWCVIYPVDFIKTLVQCDHIENPKHQSMRGYLKEEIQKGSIKNIYRGVQIMLLRAFFVNAVGFLCFQIGKKIVYPNKEQKN